MSACDICIEETDNAVCDECADDSWETALKIGRKTGINACVMKLRKQSKPWATEAANLLEKCFPEECK